MTNKYIFKGICGIMTTIVFTACGGNSINGEWVEPIPGMKGQVQGVKLDEDGKASSINMATLQYEKWEKKGDMLILSGKSIGNHQTISFTDTLNIEKLTKDELILNRDGLTINYRKMFTDIFYE